MTADAGIVVLPSRVKSTVKSTPTVMPSPVARPQNSGTQRGSKTRASRTVKKSARGGAKSAKPASSASGTAGKKRRKPSSSYRGVTWNKWHQKWTSQIRYGGKQHHLGVFADPVQAARAYDAAAFEHHKAKAVLNFPEDQAQLRKDQQQRLEKEKANQKETERAKETAQKAQQQQQHKNEHQKSSTHEKRKGSSFPNALDRGGIPLPQLDINLDAQRPPKKMQRFQHPMETQPLRQQENLLARNSSDTLSDHLLLPSEGSRELELDLRKTAALPLPLDLDSVVVPDLSLSVPTLQRQAMAALTREEAQPLQQQVSGLHTEPPFSGVPGVASQFDPLSSIIAPSPLARQQQQQQQYFESSPAPALEIAAAAASAPDGLSLTGRKTGAAVKLQTTQQQLHHRHHHRTNNVVVDEMADQERRRHRQLHQNNLAPIRNNSRQVSGDANASRPAPLGFVLHGLDRTQGGLGSLLSSSRDTSSDLLSPFDSPKPFSPAPAMSLLHDNYKYAGVDDDALDTALRTVADPVQQQKPILEGLALR